MSQDKNEKKNQTFTPPAKSYKVEFMVGLFAILGMLAFSYLAVNLAGIRLIPTDAYVVKAEFDNISGLTLGAPVEIAGVSVGSVKDIVLDDTSALVTLELSKDIQLRDDDIASVRTKGIIGDKYIKIVPGASEDLVENGGKIFDTESVVDFEDVIGRVIHSMEGSDE